MKRWLLAFLVAIATLTAAQVAAPTAAYAATAVYSPRFLDANGNPVAGATVTFWNLGGPYNSGNIIATSTTDGLGYLYPGVTLTVGQAYYFTTSSASIPNGQFVAPSPQSIIVIPANGGLFLDTSAVAQTKAGALSLSTLTPGSCVGAGTLGLLETGANCTTSVTAGAGITVGGTATVPTVALTAPVTVALGGTNATSFTSTTCIRASSGTQLASAGGDCVVLSPASQQSGTVKVAAVTTAAVTDSALTSGDCVQASTGGLLATGSNPCGTVTAVTASGNLSSSGGTTPAITMTASPTFSNITDSGLTAGNCVQASTGGLLITTGAGCGSSGSGSITSVNAGGSGNLTVTGSAGPTVTIDLVTSPSITGTYSTSAATGVALTGTGANTLTSASGGAYGAFVFNATGGTTGNLANFQLAGTTKAQITNAGAGIFSGGLSTTSGAFTSTLSAAGITSTAGIAVGGALTGGTTGNFSGALTASQFNGSGAGLTTGTVPNAALVTTPVTAVTASGNLSSSGGTTPAITITGSPTFSGTLTANAIVSNSTISSSGAMNGTAFIGSSYLSATTNSPAETVSAQGVGIGVAGTDTTWGVLIGSAIGGTYSFTNLTAVNGTTVDGIAGGALLVSHFGVANLLAVDGSGDLGAAGSVNGTQFNSSSAVLGSYSGAGGSTQIGGSGGAIAGITAQAFYVYTPAVGQFAAMDDSGNFGISGSYYAASERRLKDRIHPVTLARANYVLDHTRIVSYCYRTKPGKPCPPGAMIHRGIVADDSPTDIAPGHKSIDVESMESLTMLVVQGLRAQVRDMERTIHRLKAAKR